MTQQLPPKKEVALALLERSNVDVYLDPRAKGVVVPPQFRKEPRLILKIGLNMPVPIPDLRVDEDSMSCTLSFNRSPFYCVVPWTSVFAMVGEDGRGMVWPDDVPQELAVKVVEPGDEPRARAGATEGAREGRSETASASSASSRREPGARRATKLVEDAPSERASRAGSGAAASKRGGKKKKEEGQRPVLVAVARPSSDAEPEARPDDASSRPSAGDRPREIREVPEQRRPQPRDGVSAIPSAPRRPSPASPSSQRRPPTDGQARPKRELPPYLRVVK